MGSEAITLVSLVAQLHGGAGHVLGYHLSVARAARLGGWEHVAVVPAEHGLPELPSGWRAELEPGCVNTGLPEAARKGQLVRLLRDMRRFSHSVHSALAHVMAQAPGPCIVLLEDFNGPQLLALASALRELPAERLHLWILFRNDPASQGLVGRLYAMAASRLMRRLPRGHAQLLTDSEPLAQAVRAVFGRPVHVMPIPHTHVSGAPPFERDPQEIVCWWPGAPRPEKGLSFVRALAALPAGAAGPQRVRLVVSEDAGLRAGGGVQVQTVAARLSAAEYDRWLVTADVVLLPYEAARYRHATSGIFAEAVVAGRIPLASGGTWMAGELERHGLRELVIDAADAAAAIRRIEAVARDASVRLRLDALRERYRAYHCEASYGAALRAVLAGR